MKIRSVGTQLFHSDGRADRHDEVKGHFLQFRKSLRKMHITFRLCQSHLTELFRK